MSTMIRRYTMHVMRFNKNNSFKLMPIYTQLYGYTGVGTNLIMIAMRHKMKLLVCALSILWSINLFSQTKDSLDFKVYIKSITNDSLSRFFYPKLMEKIKSNPSGINAEECFYLYYGQIYQKNYSRNSFIYYPEWSKFNRALMTNNCHKILDNGISMLNRNFIDLGILMQVCSCMKETNYIDTVYYFNKRFINFRDAILSTGDGKSMETAIKVVNVLDEDIIKGVLKFFGGKEYSIGNHNHFYSIWEKDGQKLYFENIF